jgi:hypothetical protein
MSTHVDEKSPHEHKINLDHLEAGKVNSSDPSAIQENDFHFTFGKFLAVLVSVIDQAQAFPGY